MRVVARILLGYLAVAGFVSALLYSSMKAANSGGLRATRVGFEANHFSLDPAEHTLPPEAHSAREALATFKSRLELTDTEKATLKKLTRSDPETWTPAERSTLDTLEERAAPVLSDLASLLARPALALGPGLHEWILGNSEHSEHMIALSLGHLLTLRPRSTCLSCPPPSPYLDLTLLLDLAFHLYQQPYVIDDFLAFAVEHQALRILRRDFDSFKPSELDEVLHRLDRLSDLPRGSGQIAPEVAASARWGFGKVGLPWLGLTSEGATALWIQCEDRALKLLQEDFATAAREVDAIEAASSVSRQVVCRKLIRGRFTTLVRYELERYPRDVARSAIRVRSHLLERTREEPSTAEEVCSHVQTSPSTLLPKPLACLRVRPGCYSLSAEVTGPVLEMIFKDSDARSRFEPLLGWELCAPAAPLLSSLVS